MRVIVAGGLGFIGQELIQAMSRLGYQVTVLTHSSPTGGHLSKWDPFKGELDLDVLEAADVVINLSGEPVARRWTNRQKRKIRDSRIFSTRTLVQAIEKVHIKPTLFINASAVGYYGVNRHGELTEDAPFGEGFLASMCREWEEEARNVEAMGVRLVLPRLGMVLSKEGGSLKRLLPLFRMGCGCAFGDGRQWVSWVDLCDVVRAFLWMMQHEKISGPVNVVSNYPVTNQEFVKNLGEVLNRSASLNLPAFLVRLLFGEMGEEMLLQGAYVVPQKLLESGFAFEYATIEKSLRRSIEGGNTPCERF